jgi:hypothetical protein
MDRTTGVPLVSLFDGYPTPDDAGGPPKQRCCDLERTPPGWPHHLWAYIHQWGHSRIPFTVDGLAVTAHVAPEIAAAAIEKAETHERWIVRVRPEPYMRQTPALWVGALPRK